MGRFIKKPLYKLLICVKPYAVADNCSAKPRINFNEKCC